jgi:glycogen phosphorylase
VNPQALRSDLSRLAANYRWTWSATTRDVLARVSGPQRRHPATDVAHLSDEMAEQLAADLGYVASVAREIADLDALLDGAVSPTIAYCSPEFGLSALLPQYAGGLGVLAGDHLKSASDAGTPLAGVGLFYRDGVFRQVIEHGRQTEAYRPVDPEGVGASDTGIVVSIPFPGREVDARVWRIEVGRAPLLLLDTDIESNDDGDRRITDRLYAGSREHRVEQEMVLGVGGAKALAATGWDIQLYHLNEGHAGFIALELIDREIAHLGFEASRDRIRSGLVFTTHTPVPAGIDRFQQHVIDPYLGLWADRWGVEVDSLWELGRDPDEPTMFNMAALCLRSARTANGVSELHGEVSRKLFAGVGIGDDIGFVTNGVHARTWTIRHLQEHFDTILGDGWAQGHPDAWDRVDAIDDVTLVEARRRSSILLGEMIAERTGDSVDPDALIIGFARRFAPYKRANLFLRRPDLLEGILADDGRPVHFLFAGKAHPSDDIGKGLVADLIEVAASARAHGRITFVPDYEMDIAMALVSGSDIWLNNPIRPREASGTSGEKAVLNGTLNCSILDGWWAEMYDGSNGWEIAPSSSTDPDTRDHEESTAMLGTIATIVNEYHDSPALFQGRIRHAWRTLGPKVTSARMLRDYQTRVYDV